MASRFWVGGAGTWDTSSTTHWSATNGGAAGASAPTAADSAIFNNNSGGGVVNITTTAVPSSVNFTGFTGTITGALSCATVTLGAGGTFSGLALTQVLGAPGTITCNGKSVASLVVYCSSPGNSWTVTDALTVVGQLRLGNSGASSTVVRLKRSVTHSVGSFLIVAPSSGQHFLGSDLVGTQATLSCASGLQLLNDVNVQDIAFTGGAEWLSSTNFTNSGNNSGYDLPRAVMFMLELF